ncbi:serine/threonine protein phosphatase [Streptomyces venezuelae]|uniref:protein-serine/threonine phosphatase n=1 Tax=Streptomyces venezuelae TaxID=54571 RepID=A0A5P2D5V8_STRVZ|nr:ATP-binding SpoIIE family protein phosphatase [Streptomyces venezuelae]QES49930.1 serine/threonine protein phosphatase [Streptomyces venezuelae]
MTEYPTSHDGPQPAAAGSSDVPGPRRARRGARGQAAPGSAVGAQSMPGTTGPGSRSDRAGPVDPGDLGHGKAPAPADDDPAGARARDGLAQDAAAGPAAGAGPGPGRGAASGAAPEAARATPGGTDGPEPGPETVPASRPAGGTPGGGHRGRAEAARQARDAAAARKAAQAGLPGPRGGTAAARTPAAAHAAASAAGSAAGPAAGPDRPGPGPELPDGPSPAGAAAAVGATGSGAGGAIPAAADVTAARREGDRLRFVGAATRRIARGIDLDEIVLGLCRATVPTFSDAILVYLRDPLPVGDERPVGPVVLRLRRTDRLRPIDELGSGLEATGTAAATGAAGELDFSQLPLLGPQGDLPAAELCEIRPGGALAEVLRGVRPVFGSSAAARAALPELLGADHPVPRGQRAVLAPLRGRRRVIGAAVFLRSPERPAFEPNDLLVAAQLATHTALGIDKAVLYGREAYIADELQRTMLPDSLPQPTGVRLASRYLPAAETARVGGDWYDAIPLPGSRVALVVGDVMGHSMTSAAIMGQLRTTAQTLAQLDLPPGEVLHHLDEQAQRLGSDRMATCLYAVYDPVSHRITIANAGHPPPVLLHLGGRAEVLRVPPGAPIGVGGVDFEAVELDAPAGATLLLYTDGLVESRLRDVWTGIEQLRERLAATAQLTGLDHPPPLEALCDDVLDMLGPGDRDDDIALLAARFDGIAPSDVAYWFLDPEETAPGRARRFARRALSRWGLEELTDSLELLVSEVVTNAVRYAERPVTLRLLRTDVLRCEVGDDSPQLPRQRRARDTDEGGRGLFLVNRMARRWGATRLSSGKVVWFELGLPGGRDRH